MCILWIGLRSTQQYHLVYLHTSICFSLLSLFISYVEISNIRYLFTNCIHAATYDHVECVCIPFRHHIPVCVLCWWGFRLPISRRAVNIEVVDRLMWVRTTKHIQGKCIYLFFFIRSVLSFVCMWMIFYI